ncbi:YbaY family lipoprotein [Marinobacter nanhaiticus D15-8W]|uniref:META domain-containing protein n=1 Tax=Marinobacter nanhaiticus D15-8W TaxID=626887 RepID=N6WUF0_9GAMM|nr:YbaY family lipoprotein [Marinobacter nanhaiticus]ENO15161.1 META domain-containing protein [Marinobacter nanhaiticus D15-8W]BES69138.1 YbaY family lipoprotein [Marinobacter nanhaiticus D15-8W]
MNPTGIRRSQVGSGPAALVAVLLAALVVTGCASDAKIWGGVPNMRQIEGTVTYHERMMVPTDSTVTVILEDVSLADAPAEVVAQTSFRSRNGPPWSYMLNYDPRLIMDGRRYNLRAKVTSNDRLMFISTEANPVVPGEVDGAVDIVVNRAGGSVAAVDRPDDASDSLINTFWELKGLFGDPISEESDKRKLNIVLVKEDNRVAGFSGCNQFSGSFTRDGSKLQIGQLVSTQMACFEGLEREQQFHEALRETVRYTIEGPVLKFYNGDDEVVLEFLSGEYS